jgi:hypothetical protein
MVYKISDIVAYGLDYVRLRVVNQSGLNLVANRLPYLDIKERWFHGTMFADLTGSDLALIRCFESLEHVILEFAYPFVCTRLDVFIDVVGDVVWSVNQPGTVIMNGGKVETVYSHKLNSRGNVKVFARCYNAQAAGHYDYPVTRFEVEFGSDYAPYVLTSDGWKADPVGEALHHIKRIFDVDILIPGHESIEFNPKRDRFQHSRERFYSRYGKGILLDMSDMGQQRLIEFIRECIKDEQSKEQNGGLEAPRRGQDDTMALN